MTGAQRRGAQEHLQEDPCPRRGAQAGTGLTLFLPPPTPSPAALAAVLTQLPALLSASLHDATEARQGEADTQVSKRNLSSPSPNTSFPNGET